MALPRNTGTQDWNGRKPTSQSIGTNTENAGDEQIEKFNNHSSTTKGTIRLTLEKNHKQRSHQKINTLSYEIEKTIAQQKQQTK